MNKSDKTWNSFFSQPRNNHEYDQNQLFLFTVKASGDKV